jgi:hypothetical protein
MVKPRVLFALVVVLLVVLTACGAAATPTTVQPPVVQTVVVEVQGETVAVDSVAEPTTESMEPASAESGTAPPADEESVDAATGEETIEAQQVNTQNVQTSDRKIIYTSSLVLEVDDPRQEAQALYGVALRYGGFVSSANVYEYGKDLEGNPVFRADMQLRIAATNFVPAQEELRGIANAVISEQATTQDVTGEYVDVESRIRNLQRLEEEMQILLTEARARSDAMEEVLNIYREITTIREEIEVLQGRINVLSDLVGLATINITLIAPELPPAPTPTPTPEVVWDPGATTQDAVNALTKDLQGATDDGIWFVVTGLPRLLVLGVVLLIAYIIGRRIWVLASPYLTSSSPTITPPPPPPPS